MSNATHRVFVYGSLKQGFGNYRHFLSQSKFCGKAVTLKPAFNMFSLGGFPGVQRGEHAIAGELYVVNAETFKRLDRLEGNGSLYQREKVSVVDPDGKVTKAWMYIFLGTPWGASRNDNVDHMQTDAGFFVQNWAEDRY